MFQLDGAHGNQLQQVQWIGDHENGLKIKSEGLEVDHLFQEIQLWVRNAGLETHLSMSAYLLGLEESLSIFRVWLVVTRILPSLIPESLLFYHEYLREDEQGNN